MTERQSTGLGRGCMVAVAMAVFLWQAMVPGSAGADQFDDLRHYWLKQLVGANLNPSSLKGRASAANSCWKSMDASASRTCLWKDLPFNKSSPSITASFSRLKVMALAWATPGCSLYRDPKLAAAVNGGLDWMTANVYTTTAFKYGNWWDWEIGAPHLFNDAQVLMYPSLTPNQINNYAAAVDRYCPPSKITLNGGKFMTGANLSGEIKAILVRAILQKNSEKMAYGQTNLSPVFNYVNSGDGFYRDGSFIQHNTVPYNGGYGASAVGEVAELVNLLNGSKWAISETNKVVVCEWMSKALQPFVYNGSAMMDMVRGRTISRQPDNGVGHINTAKQVARFAPPATAVALNKWVASPTMPAGQYHFPGMDRVVAWRKNFCFGLSMSSTRIANYEGINNENLHGWFTGDGMTYLYLGETETQFNGDFWPTVDPYHLPGTTADTTPRGDASGQRTTTSQKWVGGAQVAGRYGVAGMSLSVPNFKGSMLTGRKSWFMFDNEVVCLGAGITAGSSNEIHTTVENRRVGTSPTKKFILNGRTYPPRIGWTSGKTPAIWCALDGTAGYYFPGGANNVQAAFVSGSGAWGDINKGKSKTVHTNNYLKLWFNHGIAPTNAAYAYVILPDMSPAQTRNYAANPDIQVIQNTAAVQAAGQASLGLVAANFWTAGTNSAGLVTVDSQASVITMETRTGIAVGVSDPTQANNGSITVTLNRAARSAASVDPGVTVVQLAPKIVLSVNVKGSLGRTFRASFFRPL